MPKPLAIVALCLGLLISVGVPVARAGGPAAGGVGGGGGTQVIIFHPSGAWTGPILAGSCFTSSIAVSRPGVYRCSAGNFILDPCFKSSLSGPSVICQVGRNPLGPGRRLMLSKPLPAIPPSPVGTGVQAWILILADGTMCTVSTGAAGVVVIRGKHVGLMYYCSDGSDLANVRQGPTWTATRVYLARNSAQVLRVVTTAIRTVYR